MSKIKQLIIVSATFIGMIFSISLANADTKLSIGSCPIGCTAYTWSAGIADVINNNVPGVSLTAEETKGYVANELKNVPKFSSHQPSSHEKNIQNVQAISHPALKKV